jgi:hypothetical protein
MFMSNNSSIGIEGGSLKGERWIKCCCTHWGKRSFKARGVKLNCSQAHHYHSTFRMETTQLLMENVAKLTIAIVQLVLKM